MGTNPENQGAVQPTGGHMRFAILVLLLLSTPAVAALGPTNPPPGITASAWRQMSGRADWVTRSVAVVSPNANTGCLYAVIIELLAESEVAWSQDASGRGVGSKRSVAAGKEKDFLESIKKNTKEQCNGGSGGGGTAETLKGILKFTAKQSEWQEANYDRLKMDVSRAVEALVKMGIFVPVAEGAAAAASISVPILDPRLFAAPHQDVSDGT